MKTITNIIISHLAFLVLFGGATLAFAQTEEETTETATEETTTTDEPSERPVSAEGEEQDNREVRQEERENALEEIQAEREEAIEERAEAQAERQAVAEERRANLDARARERIVNLAANMSNRIEAAIARMQNIADRLESRIEKIAESGRDTTEASTALASARLSLDNARAGISDIDSAVVNAVGSENVRSAWPEVRTTFEQVRDQLITAQAELRNSVTLLKTATEERAENPVIREETI